MGAVEVVVVQPEVKVKLAFEGVGVSASVGPFAQRGLDEALGLAIGARSVRPGEAMLDMLLGESFLKAGLAIAGAVIGEHAADGDGEAGVIGPGHEEEQNRGAVGLVRHQGGEADAGVIVDGDVQVFPAGPARFLSSASVPAMAGAHDPAQALHVEMDHIAGMLVFVANHRRRRIERAQTVQSGTAQDAADRGPAESQFSTKNDGVLPALRSGLFPFRH